MLNHLSSGRDNLERDRGGSTHLTHKSFLTHTLMNVTDAVIYNEVVRPGSIQSKKPMVQCNYDHKEHIAPRLRKAKVFANYWRFSSCQKQRGGSSPDTVCFCAAHNP